MFQNYLATALSNLARNWLYAAISIFGLAVSFAGAIMVAQFVRNELTYERWIPGYERVHKLTHHIQQPGRPKSNADLTQTTLKKQIKDASPQVEQTARLMMGSPMITPHSDTGPGTGANTGEDGQIDQTFAWVDPEFFEVLPLPAVEGDPKTALRDPDTVVMTEKAAFKYFGKKRPMGETLNVVLIGPPGSVNSPRPMKVAAILKDLPSNTSLVTEIFATGVSSYAALSVIDRRPPARTGIAVFTFVRMKEGSTKDDLLKALEIGTAPEIAAWKNVNVNAMIESIPIADWHLHPSPLTAAITKPAGSETTAYAIAAVGALIVLVAGINFVTLMTARASRRALEVGVRKMNGATRSDLIVQFMGEALIYAFLSMILAVGLAGLLMQPFSDFVQRGLTLDFIADPMLGVVLIGVTIFIGLLGGIYPALVLSSFKPQTVFKGGASQSGGRSITRTSLVVVQFAILIGLILATATIYRQTQFALSQGLGKDSELIVQVQTPCNTAFPAEVRKLPGVVMAACSSPNALASASASNITGVKSQDGVEQIFSIAPVDFDFFETFDIKPLAGRLFERSRGNDGPLPVQGTAAQQPLAAAPAGQANQPPPTQLAARPVILNEAATLALGYATPQDAVGKMMIWAQPGAGPAPLPSEIIGVTPDIPITIGAKASPHFYFIAPQMLSRLSIKTTGEDLPGTVSEIQRVWKETGATRPIQLSFFAETRRVQYLDIIIQGVMIGICALAAVTIACLGLFALSAFAAERRTREIGVRKALGATTGNVIGLLMWQFTVPVLWAIAIALPIGYLLMTNWLQGFAYHVDLDPWLFVLAAGAALAVAWITVSVQTWLVARAKPVKALRHE